MRNVFDLVDTRELVATIRSLEFGRNELQRYLPNSEVVDIDFRLIRLDRLNRAAPIRAFDTPAPRGRRPGATEMRGALPPISEILDLTESERLRLRRLVGGGDVGDLIAEAIFNDAALSAAAVANRLELLRGEAMWSGMIVIDENGVAQAVDYEIPALNKVAAPIAWTATNADIVNDFFTWQEQYVDEAGDGAVEALMSTRARSLALRNAGVRDLVGTSAPQATPQALNDVLEANGLPRIRVYDRKVEDATGVVQRVIPEDRVIFLPGDDNRIGETQLGVTEEAVTLVNARELDLEDAPGLVAVTMVSDEPVRTSTKVAGIGLPVIDQPNRILTADVF